MLLAACILMLFNIIVCGVKAHSNRLTPPSADRLLIIYDILRHHLFSLLKQLCTVGHTIFNISDLNIFLLGNWNCLFYHTNVLKQFLSGKVLHGILLHLLLDHGNFLYIDILQCSVATWLRHGGLFKDDYCKFIVESNSERVWKICKHWQSYRQDYDVLFFGFIV